MRAWRSYEAFQGRSSVRTWLYQIATNACLSALSHRSRRFLPSGLGGPADDPMTPPTAAEGPWVQPLPDSMLDPAAIVAARDSLGIALIATLQKLPGRQRAVFVLRDVLEWPASDVAQVMGTSTAAVKSTLQRARARLAQEPPDVEQTLDPGKLSTVLVHYIATIEEADGAALVNGCCVSMPRSRRRRGARGSPAVPRACPISSGRSWVRREPGGCCRPVRTGSPRRSATSTVGPTASSCSPSPGRASRASTRSGTRDSSSGSASLRPREHEAPQVLRG